MGLPCKRCKSTNTQPKTIWSKKKQKNFEVIECQNGCKEGNYKFSFFPDEVKPDTGKPLDNMILEQILIRVKNIENMLSNPQARKQPVDEMQPDSDVPW